MSRAGEIAPDVVVSKLIHSPMGTAWTRAQPESKLTILEFYPQISNRQMYRVHNQRVERYAHQNIQFVLIGRDEESTLQHWLDKYRIELKGWVVLDAKWETARAFGIRLPQTAIIDSTGRVVGFSRHDDDTDRQIGDVVEGRTEAAGLCAHSDFDGILTPALPPSDMVHISPAHKSSGTIASVAPDHWVALGFTLQNLLAKVCGTPESLMDLSWLQDRGGRNDVRLALAVPEDQKQSSGASNRP